MRPSRTFRLAAAATCLALVPVSALQAGPAGLEGLLSRRIVETDLPLAEVQEFTESRVPILPAFSLKAQWETYAKHIRKSVLEDVVLRGEAAGWRNAQTRVEWLRVIEGGPGYRIRKLRFEALPGLWIPALLYEPVDVTGKVPCILNVNGHEGIGKSVPYKQARCINEAKRGMLALNVEWLGMGQLNGAGYAHSRMNQLDLCGTSGIAPFYLSMKRSIDVLLSLPHADPERLAVAGLSGGGWQTIFISSLDTRVRLADPVAGYSSFRTRARYLSDLGDSEQTPCDLATVADYTHLTALLAPRPALLTFNAKDNCCFAAAHALPPLLAAARPVYAIYGKEDFLQTHVNEDPGTHNFLRDNREALYRKLGRHFFPASSSYPTKELPFQDEIKPHEDLLVELPDGNADFHRLAVELSSSLPRDAGLPTTKEGAARWMQARREALQGIVRCPSYEVRAERAGAETAAGGKGAVSATFWELRLGGEWTLPAVELSPAAARGTALLAADRGCAGEAALVSRLLGEGLRVVAVDPFYLGQSRITKRDYLFALLVAAVGERPLGIQAAQLAAVARWLEKARKAGPVRLVASGPRTSLMALVAAALETRAIGELELHGSFGSLHEIIEKDMTVTEAPELFCFGLLETFDIRQLTALAAPRPVRFPEPGKRLVKELSNLEAWYRLFGATFDLKSMQR